MAFLALKWRNAVIERSRRGYQDLLTALAVGHRRASAALSEVFRSPALDASTRRVLLGAHGDLDAALDALERHLVGVPGWWADADTLVRRVADALLLAIEYAPAPKQDHDSWSFEDQKTSVFSRPDLDAQQTLPL